MINFWKRKELRIKIEKMIVIKLKEYLTKYIYKENREASVDKYKNEKKVLKN